MNGKAVPGKMLLYEGEGKNFMKTTKILLAGHFALDPLGRHAIAFLKTFLNNPTNEIYIERESLLGDSTTLLDLFGQEIAAKRVHFSDEKSSNFNYDFLVFTDSISCHPKQQWETRHLKRNAKIKICYPVFDGSVPPLHWIEVINKFDLCLCPSEYCAHNLRRYGVKIDCFGLECATLIEDFLKITPRKEQAVFRIGSIGASDFRKNLPLLMHSFAKAFSKKDNVELFIHSSYGKDLNCDDEIVRVYNECKENSNIVLQLKKISHPEMAKLWSSFDAYVSPQTTTGFFTTPLEACAVGLPVILSDIHPHLELTKFVPEKDNLFFVKHDKMSTALHWAFDYRNLGVKFDATEEAYVNMFRYVYQHRHQLRAERLVQERKAGAAKLSAQALAPYYNLIFHPSKIAVAKTVSHLDEKNNVFFMSETLAQKYEKYGFGKIENIPDAYAEKVYPEENSSIFQALEQTAVDEHKIWIKQYYKCPPKFLESAYMKCILQRAEKYHIHQMPWFIYKLFSQYCKLKSLITKESK